ncbi:MAG: N-acetylmuramoyl-L-alanine amidase, partial [Clostridia bacterium]|nr:N-acetylmuramoyl-L-alanine amidase [Clostridia bacterium]
GTAARGVGEKVYSMQLATLIYNKLVANGNFNVYMTRTGDYDLELYQRCEIANSYNADIVISIHFDGNPVKSLNGVTTFTSVFDKYAAVSLSQSIAKNISEATGLKNNGVKRREDNEGHYWDANKQWDFKDPSLGALSDYYGIPTWAANFGMKSIIVEHGYLSNQNDVNLVLAEGAFEKMAEAEANAIISYYTNHTHNYASSPERDYPSNCIYTGKQSVHCLTCGHRKNVTSLSPAPDNHYWVVKSQTPASCGTDGKIVRECRVTEKLAARNWTGETHTETVTIPAPTDHTMEMTENVKATHTVDGYQTFKCKTCSYSFKDIIKAEGHTYEYVGYTAPTCEKSGGDTYKCKGCTSTYTDKEEALGHSYEIVEKLEPTCTEKGRYDKKCDRCEKEETDWYDPLGHKLPEGAEILPTCEEDGKRSGKCTVCSVEIDEVLSKTGHNMEVTEKTKATCTDGGKKTTVCLNCEYTKEEDTEPLGHSFEEAVVKEATCEEDGQSTLTCKICSYTEEKTVKAVGHKKAEKGTVVKKSGLFSKGEVSYACENGCGETFTENTA